MRLASLILIAFTIFGLTACGNSLDKKLLGKWAWEQKISREGGSMSGDGTMKCIENYFPNKSVTTECELKITGHSKESKDFNSEIDATLKIIGEWSVIDQTVFEKFIDAKVDVVKFAVNGEPVTDEAIVNDLRKDMRSEFLVGETDASKTISIDEKKWVFEAEVEKKQVTFTATRL